MKNELGEMTFKIKVNIYIDWKTAIKMMLIGRYPAAIIARAIAEKIKTS